MNKKFITSLLVSSLIATGIAMPVYAKEQPNYKRQLSVQPNVDQGPINYRVYVEEQLMAKGYPVDNIIYDFSIIYEMDGCKTFFIEVYAGGILVPNAHITMRTTPFGHVFVNGTSSEEIKKVSGVNWHEKVKLSKDDAIYYGRYAVYMKTLRNVTENQVKVNDLYLSEINGEYVPHYSLTVSSNENSEHWKVLINAETGEAIEVSKN